VPTPIAATWQQEPISPTTHHLMNRMDFNQPFSKPMSFPPDRSVSTLPTSTTLAAPPHAALRLAGKRYATLLVVLMMVLSGCSPNADGHEQSSEVGANVPSAAAPRAETLPPDSADVVARTLDRIDQRLAAVDALFQPLPLLRSAQETALRQSSYQEQLSRARDLGVGRSPSEAQLDTLQRRGRLVPLADGTHWIVRTLDYSQPLVVPALHDALTEIGERFHARLQALGAPPFRMEISSALRTAADQRALRDVNANAASGESTHEYGTSVDLAYSAFAAPAEPVVSIQEEEAPWATDYLRRYQNAAAGRVAARRALELKAILGAVLLDVQQDGLVLITLERRQPVFHLTIARRPDS